MTTSIPAPKMILSIQSHVSYGYVGNSAAVFTLQRLGFEVLPVNTVQFSNHTGYGSYRGEIFSEQHIKDVIQGLKENGALERVDAVLSGYMGDASIGNAIVDAVKQVQLLNPQAIYLCDPVMGDADDGRGIFVKKDIPAFMKNIAVPVATIISPNHFEFELLVENQLKDISDAIAQARKLMEKTELKTIIITSLSTPDIPQKSVGTLAVTAKEAWLVTTPRISLKPMPSGMGDTFASIFLGRTLQGYSTDQALVLATSTLYALIKHTVVGSLNLPLVALQKQIVMPSEVFDVVAIPSS